MGPENTWRAGPLLASNEQGHSLTFSCTFLHSHCLPAPIHTFHNTAINCSLPFSSLVCAATPAALLCSQFNQWLSLAVPQKADKTSQLQTQLSASPYTGIQVATREPTQCPERVHSSPFSSPQLTGSEEGNVSAGLGSGGRRLLLTACLPVYTGSGKTVNFSHGGDKWKNQNARE